MKVDQPVRIKKIDCKTDILSLTQAIGLYDLIETEFSQINPGS